MNARKTLHRNMLPIFGFIAFVFLALGCAEREINVKWENYSPIVKQRIDELVASKGCNGLQKEFDAADRSSDNQRRRTGESNAELMAYIDEKIREVGCYT